MNTNATSPSPTRPRGAILPYILYMTVAAILAGVVSVKLQPHVSERHILELFGVAFFTAWLPGALWLARSGGPLKMLQLAAMIVVFPLSLFFFGWLGTAAAILLMPPVIAAFEKRRKALP